MPVALYCLNPLCCAVNCKFKAFQHEQQHQNQVSSIKYPVTFPCPATFRGQPTAAGIFNGGTSASRDSDDIITPATIQLQRGPHSEKHHQPSIPIEPPAGAGGAALFWIIAAAAAAQQRQQQQRWWSAAAAAGQMRKAFLMQTAAAAAASASASAKPQQANGAIAAGNSIAGIGGNEYRPFPQPPPQMMPFWTTSKPELNPFTRNSRLKCLE